MFTAPSGPTAAIARMSCAFPATPGAGGGRLLLFARKSGWQCLLELCQSLQLEPRLQLVERFDLELCFGGLELRAVDGFLCSDRVCLRIENCEERVFRHSDSEAVNLAAEACHSESRLCECLLVLRGQVGLAQFTDVLADQASQL